MFYNDELKKLIGQYFKWHRINNNKTMKEVSENLNIDYRTYKDIENGIIKKNDEYYDKLKKYYDVSFHDNFDLFNECIQLIPLLYEAVENNDNDSILKITQNINENIYKLKEYPFYKELYKSMNIIKEYYIHKKYLSLEEIDETIKLMNLWNNECSSILLEVCEKTNLNKFYSYEISDKLYKNIVIRDAISKYWYADECITQSKYMHALELCDELIDYFSNKNNLKRKCFVMLRKFGIYRDFDQEKAINYVNLLISITDEDIDIVQKRNIFYSVALFYYFKSKFNDAVFYFEKYYSLGKRASCLLFIYACESRLDCLKIKDDNLDSQSSLSPYVDYYIKKANHTDNKLLEDYIMNDLMPLLKKEKYKEPLWSMFEYELLQLVKKTRNYKNIHIFTEKMLLSTKSAT